MSLDYDLSLDERKAVKSALQLALSRYRDTFGKFVQGKASRLAYVDDHLTRLAHECSAAVDADPFEVEKQLRIILAEEVAVSEPEKVDVETPVGGEEGNKYKYEDGRPEMEGVADSDIKETGPVLEEESREPDASVKLSCQRCSKHDHEEGSIFCGLCNNFVTGASEFDPKEAMTPINCPYCGGLMQAPAAGATPGAGQGQFQCPNCGATVMAQPGVQQQVPAFQQPADGGLGQRLRQGPVAKIALDQDGDGVDDIDPNVQSPAESDPSTDQPELPPAVEEPEGLAGNYSNKVEEMGNAQAAMTWSTAGDQDIQDIADAYGIDPQTVQENLKVVADFGDAVAVNGDIGGDTDTEGYTELDQFGGRIPTTEEEVDVDSAIQAVADAASLDPGDVYSVVEESYGSALSGQHYVSVAGDARFYLPSDLLPQAAEEPAEDVDPIDSTPEEAYVSSTTPTRFRSLTEFLDWDKKRHASVSA